MSDIHFAVLAPPDKHREIMSRINTWKYPIKGKHFKGKQSPYIMEFRQYGVRLPDEIEGQFVRDFGLSNPEDFFAGQVAMAAPIRFKIFQILFKLIRKLTPYKPVERAPGIAKYRITPWYYSVALGKLKRKPVKTEVGTEREVL